MALEPAPGTPVGAAVEGLLARSAALLDGVEGAVRRVADGTYGTCEACGAPVGADRLDADPAAARCSRHAPPPPAPG